MHALVFGLVEQGADPAVVVLHAAQSPQVLQRPAHHSRHGGNGFEDDGTVAIALGEEGIGEKTQHLHEAECKAVR